MILSVKNKKLPGLIEQTSLSLSDQDEIKANMSMFVNHIENTLSESDIQRIVVEALGRDFLRK